MNSYYFSANSKDVRYSVSLALSELLGGAKPVICCIGTDAVAGDSLGPLIGTMLGGKLFGKSYIYGTLDKPITAKDVVYLNSYLKYAHNESKILAIDAAVGNYEEVGYIKLFDSSLKPGLGVKKDLMAIGDVSIIGIVGSKSDKNSLLNVRLSSVYALAGAISDGIVDYFDKIYNKNDKKTAL